MSRDPGHVPFSKNFLRAHIRTIPLNMPVKFEVNSFNRFGEVVTGLIDRSTVHRHTDRGTWNENCTSAINSLQFVEIIIQLIERHMDVTSEALGAGLATCTCRP